MNIICLFCNFTDTLPFLSFHPPFILFVLLCQDYSFPFRLVTISIVLTFLDKNLFTTIATIKLPIPAIKYDSEFTTAGKSYESPSAA